METKVTEIASGIYRLSTHVPQVAPPAGFTFNQFLIDADEPLLYHCGDRQLFPLVSAAVAGIIPLEKLRWISFGHIEGDECGSLREWFEVAPRAEVIFTTVGGAYSVLDMCAGRWRPTLETETVDLGGKRVRAIPTPHVPHGWEAQVMFEETTKTLFCGDLFAQAGDDGPITNADLIDRAMKAERIFRAIGLTPRTAPIIRRLADLAPGTLALMHGPTFKGDGAAQLRALADALHAMLRRQLDAA